MVFNEKGLLTSVSLEDSALKALKIIKEESDPTIIGLKCRWQTLNKAILKNWRFKNLVLIAGASGGAKSYILNMLRTDFTDTTPITIPSKGLSAGIINNLVTNGEFHLQGDNLVRPALNGDYKSKILWLHFGFDMAPEVEMIRTAAIICGFNYSYMLSSNATLEGDKYIYNSLTDEELYVIKRVMKAYVDARPNVIMFREPGTIKDIEIVIDKYANRYPDYKLGISIDHTLLVNKGTLSSDTELNNEQIKKWKDVRDIYDALVIPLAQMNSEIEDDRRKLNKTLHYPNKSDIYCGGQLFQSSDFVFTAFMPESIHLTKYGPDEIPTKNLIHFSMIKSRHGNRGHIWLNNELGHGQITELKRKKTLNGYEMIPQKTLIKSL